MGRGNARRAATVYRSSVMEMETDMVDRDRIKGAAKTKAGAMKKAAGKLTGDEKLKREGQSQQLRGKVQNTAGGVKDALRESRREHR